MKRKIGTEKYIFLGWQVLVFDGPKADTLLFQFK